MGNFFGNRHWTWLDRRHHHADKSLPLHFAQYALACWVGIALQFLFTNILVLFLHYLPANFIAIAAASVVNYLVNDTWTFGKRSRRREGGGCGRPLKAPRARPLRASGAPAHCCCSPRSSTSTASAASTFPGTATRTSTRTSPG